MLKPGWPPRSYSNVRHPAASGPLHLLSLILGMLFVRNLHGSFPHFFQVSTQMSPIHRGFPNHLIKITLLFPLEGLLYSFHNTFHWLMFHACLFIYPLFAHLPPECSFPRAGTVASWSGLGPQAQMVLAHSKSPMHSWGMDFRQQLRSEEEHFFLHSYTYVTSGSWSLGNNRPLKNLRKLTSTLLRKTCTWTGHFM